MMIKQVLARSEVELQRQIFSKRCKATIRCPTWIKYIVLNVKQLAVTQSVSWYKT